MLATVGAICCFASLLGFVYKTLGKVEAIERKLNTKQIEDKPQPTKIYEVTENVDEDYIIFDVAYQSGE